jgi:hypothetical protein
VSQIYDRLCRDGADPVVYRYRALEFTHTPPSLQNVILATLIQMGYVARGRHGHKRFYRLQRAPSAASTTGRS